MVASLFPAVDAQQEDDFPRSPPWMSTGLERALADLWIQDVDAVGETPEPIDFGDRWAWAGDNAKLLSVLARTELIHGREADEMRRFIENMTHGPILFQRWANTHQPLILSNTTQNAEASNHLLTLRVDKENLRVSLEFEYHDGRDKRMVEFAPARVFVDGTWKDPPTNSTRIDVHSGPGFVEVRFIHPYGLESFRLDGHPGMLHSFESSASVSTAGVRFRQVGLEVVSTDRVLDAGHYRQLYLPGSGTRTPSQVKSGAEGPLAWLLLLDRGTTDEFANGLLISAQDRGSIARVSEVQLRDEDTGALREVSTEHASADDGRWSERVVPLVGLVTAKPELYGELAGRLLDEELQGRDLSLSYEYSETVLGLLHFATARDDDGVLSRATTMLEHYLSFYQRGTQTRSLASGILAALLLHEKTGDSKWVTEANNMAKVLRTYQVQDNKRADVGAVINEPKGGPFLDSTILSARAWHELFVVTKRLEYKTWSDQAWASLETKGERIFVKGDEADDNHWTFKSGLVLQGAPEIRDDLLWAARNQLWTTLRDLDSMQFMTSRFTEETNSETQAWALLGVYQDWKTHEGPWILDAEGNMNRLSDPEQRPVRLQAPWVGSYVWIEKGWLAVDALGVPEQKEPGPFDSWRYTSSGPVLFLHEVEPRRLAAGWNSIGFPGLEGPGPAERLLQHLPVKIAWTIDPLSGEWQHWRPNDTASTITVLQPGQGLLLELSREAFLEAPPPNGHPAVLRPGWNLAVPPAKSNAEWWRGVDVEHDPLPVPNALAGPFAAKFIGVDVSGEPPEPPMLIVGRIEQDFVHRLRGGLVEARLEGELLATTRLGLNGSYRLVVAAPPGTEQIDLIHYDPAEQQIERVRIDYVPGTVTQPLLEPLHPSSALRPSVLVVFVVLLAALLAVVTLSIAWKRALTRDDSAPDPMRDLPRTKTSPGVQVVRAEGSSRGRP